MSSNYSTPMENLEDAKSREGDMLVPVETPAATPAKLPGGKKVVAPITEEIQESELGKQASKGTCVLISPLTYDDDEDGQERELLRTKFMRKIVGKVKDGKTIIKGGHVKDLNYEEDNVKITVVWFDDEKLSKELELCHFSMPLNIDSNYADDEFGSGGIKVYGVTDNGKAQVEDEQPPGIIERIMDIFETDEEVDYISAPFRWDKKELFAGIEDPDTFFRSALRSYLTHHILIRTDVSKKKDMSDGINIRGLNYLKLKGVYTDVFILHDRPSTLHRRQAFKEKDDDTKVVDPRQELWDSWKQWYRFQPLWKIRNYFGEKIAFYFAWVGLYSESLILPTIFGLIVFFYGLSFQDKFLEEAINLNSTVTVTTRIYYFFTVFNNPLTPWFALVLCLWGTWFVEQWKRKSNSLKYEWDVSNFEQLEPDRPQFYGSKTRKNPITDEEEWFYPFYKLYLKLSFSAVLLLFMVALVIASTIGIIVFRVASLSEKYINSDTDRNSIGTSLVSSIINATVIMVLGFVYEKIAYLLTDWENHRTQTDYDDALIIKLFAFQFVNNYASLFYIAFFKESASNNGIFSKAEWKDTCDFKYEGTVSCFPMLVMQVAILLIMKPMPKFFKDVIIPTLKYYLRIFYKRFKMGDKFCCCCMPCCCSCIRPESLETLESGTDKKKELIDIIEEDRRLIPGDNDFTLTEYTEKTIMYGMIVLFGTVFPLAPLIAIICNLVDIRVDAYRILWKNRRYIAQRAEDIGIWQYILEFLNMVGVVINSLIIAHTLNIDNGSVLADIKDRWLVAFAFEHVVFGIKFLIAYMIPDVPSDVQFKMRKEQFQVNRLFERGPTKKDGTNTDTKV